MVGQQEKRVKVLFLASWYPNNERPLSGIFIKRHAQAISKFCDVTVLYIHPGKESRENKIEEVFEDGVETIRIYLKRPVIGSKYLRKLTHFVEFLVQGFKGVKLAKRKLGRLDIIHAHVVFPMGLFGGILSRFTGIPVVITEHTSPFSVHARTAVHKALLQFVLFSAKVIMPVSSSLQKQMERYYSTDKYRVIPNVIDTGFFYPYSNKYEDHSQKRLIHISLLDNEQKNISGLLCAVSALSQKRDDFELHIVGDGKDYGMLVDLAKNLDILDKYVFFYGRMTDSDLADMLRESDIFVLNSNHETFAVVCAEALASGIPVLATRCGGPEDYITPQVGMLIEPGNTEELVRAIDKMLMSHKSYDPKSLHDYVEQKFGVERIGMEIYNIYNTVLEGRTNT